MRTQSENGPLIGAGSPHKTLPIVRLSLTINYLSHRSKSIIFPPERRVFSKQEKIMHEDPPFFLSFGEALKDARKRRKLTQKQLAHLLGVHYNTISAWELGAYLPETRGLVLELARHLALDGHETRQLLEASLTTLAPL